MAYFPNGTSGMIFEERWCSRCVHDGGPDGPGCPVMLAHLLYSYELCNEEDHPGKVILDLLIPDEPPPDTPHCAMFHEATAADRERQDRAARVAEDRARYETAMREMREAAADEALRIGVRWADDTEHPATSREVGQQIAAAILATATPTKDSNHG